MQDEQITTLSIFNYTSIGAKLWAFGMMQFAHAPLNKAKGCTFYKLLGSGKENFNPFPDWTIYAVLQVWNSEADARNFIDNSTIYKKYKSKSAKHHILFLQSIQARGEWNGGNPFKKTSLIKEDALVCAITRATIKLSKLRTFWKFVPYSQQPLLNAKGLLYTKGFGELPFVEMATFSIWENAAQLNHFAYQSREHIEAIQKTKSIKWYKEELFSRFQISSHEGDLLSLEAD